MHVKTSYSGQFNEAVRRLENLDMLRHLAMQMATERGNEETSDEFHEFLTKIRPV